MVYEPDEIQQLIEELEQKIQELLSLPVLNDEGDIVSYADLEA